MSILFISHCAADHLIARALRDAIDKLLRESDARIEVHHSSSADRGPQGGDEWRDWIEQQVVEARTALIVLTRYSVTRPWPLWEAAACRGVALQRARDKNDPVWPKIIALTYGIGSDECPDPFRGEQISSGETPEDVEAVFTQVLECHGMEARAIVKAGKKMDEIIESYLSSVRKALLEAPSLVTEATVQDWLIRLDKLAEDHRWSELAGFQRWMNFAFGHDQGTMRRQIDVRLHRRLGDYHLEHRDFEQAVEQLRLARESAPRDIYVLSRLTESLIKRILESDEHESAEAMRSEIEELLWRIESLDPDALYANPDTAAVLAKYERRIKKQPEKAIVIYSRALEHNPDSYYLADVLGQAQMEIGKIDEAKKVYAAALAILERLQEHNVWSLATKATACFVLNEPGAAEEAIIEINALKPTRNQRASIRTGILDISDKIEMDNKEMERLLEMLDQEGV